MKCLYDILGCYIVALCVELWALFIEHETTLGHVFRSIDQPKTFKKTSQGIRYLEIGDASKPLLLFIHGAPGSMRKWRKMLRSDVLYTQYRVLFV